MTNIDDLQNNFTEMHSQSLAIGKKLAGSIDMLSIGDVQETIARSVVEIEGIVGRKTSMLEKLPWAGKFLTKARDKAKEEQLKSGSIVATVDRLFQSLSNKNDNVMEVMEDLYKIREHAKQYLLALTEQEAEVLEFLQDEELSDTFEGQKARNLLAQIKPSIIKTRDHIAIMNGNLNAAQVASSTISGMLPSLQGELQTSLAINGAMNELKEFKDIFDSTIDLIEELNHTNNTNVQETILSVNELTIHSPKGLKRLEQNQIERAKLNEKLTKQTEQAKLAQLDAIDRMTSIQNNQLALPSGDSE